MEASKFLNTSIKEAFAGMYDEAITLAEEIPAPVMIKSRGVTVVIGITGETKGRVLLDMSMETALDLARRLDQDMNDEDFALLTAAEFCNIASGGVITAINNTSQKAALRLAPPSIFSGANSKIFSPNLKAVQLSYSTQSGQLDFYIGFEGA